MLLQVVLSCGAQAGALARVDGLSRQAEVGTGAEADFDENRHHTILHHEIDLAERAAVVAPEHSEPGALQVARGERLRRRTVALS